jgi:uncharacterized repeat protein (TIGR03803 family)
MDNFSIALGPNLTTLVIFNGADGANPGGSLFADDKDNLFGTTANGGAAGLGTVFEIVKTDSGYSSTPTTLVSFSGADGEDPLSNLIADDKGNLFGTTNFGGANGGGTVFEIIKTATGYASTPTTLVNFCSLPNCADGANPEGAGVIADDKGNLFGTTGFGGANGNGTVFEIAKTHHGYASTPTILVSFCSLPNCADGSFPVAGLIADDKGNLFGTTDGGGAAGLGTVFEVVKTSSGYSNTPTTLVSFGGADGAHPRAALIADPKGNLFGTTSAGGTDNLGTVFEVVKTHSGYSSTPTTLASFSGADGAGPNGLIADTKGNLFGTTSNGGTAGLGTVFQVVKTDSGYSSTPTTLASLCSLANCADGANPAAGLIADAKGNLFGTAFEGGNNNNGTVFEVTGSGFVIFAGTPGKPNCFGQSVSALARQYGGLNAAAEALGYPSVRALQKAILEFCEG